MPINREGLLEKLNNSSKDRHNLRQIVTSLSFVVVLLVFWSLKLTGIGIAGEAFCGIQEHSHDENCTDQETVCQLEEHTHVENCYSDLSADLETGEDWELSLDGIVHASTTKENMVLVAQSQLGCSESTLNFQVDANGVRRGITRYGQWYGNPYGDWSTMFATFCLHYAGVGDVPFNSGAEAMRLAWEKEDLYRPAEAYAPRVGDLLFLHTQIQDPTKDAGEAGILSADHAPGSRTANTVAIITEVSEYTVTAIQGNVHDTVAETTYSITDPAILGYGLIPENSSYTVMVEPPAGSNPVAVTANYSTSLITDTNQFVFYVQSGGKTYAMDGTGNAVQIYIDEDGRIFTDLADPNQLLWSVASYNSSSWAIRNAATGRYLHPFFNSNTDNGITTPGRWGTSMNAAGTGVKFSHSAYIGLDLDNGKFRMVRNQGENVTFQVGISRKCTVWLDGTDGGIMSLGGSDNLSYSVNSGNILTLPTQWKSPDKYAYALKGWYDVVNNRYYEPGAEVPITGDTVFYADWAAGSYDVGQFNSQVANTVSTNSFVTTRMFDYSALFNVYSQRADVTFSSSGHTEIWNLLTSGNNPYNGEPTLNFILRDWDRGNEDISYPKGHNDRNNPTSAGTVYPGLYTDTIRDLMFDPETQAVGKQYLGQADHLFQLCLDPNHEHYGYYYYNSERNAASYNQSDQRFYVYEYLECTRDSAGANNEGKYSDFLPLNSPYANTNGKKVNTYSYEGVEGEYGGTTHYMYDTRYNDSNNSTSNVGTNFWFGMSVEVEFYLPNAPGVQANGAYGNQDIYGNDMHFQFTGDDDVWILVDDKLVLDLGGLHGRESGDINFATGEVTINGVRNDALTNTLRSISAGEHVLTLYYLERGSSMSNCAIYFNLAPRFDFNIQKEDVLTRDVLNGAQFSVYMDKACTIPAELWPSKASHDNHEPATNIFTVEDGVAHMWGMGAGNTYYIKESRPPDNSDYGFANGLICLTFDQLGTASYQVEILDAGEGISGGFTVHGFRIDTEKQEAYIVATNAPKWVTEVTSVQVVKRWNDSLDHSGQPVTVYLTVKDTDGTVRRLQEAELNKDNQWTYRWENLPKYEKDGVTPVEYGVEESYTSGYYSSVEKITGEFEIVQTQWQDVTSFENGKVYILKNASGQALATLRSAEDTGYRWIDAEEAKTSSLALWTASVRGGAVRLTNGAGQTITFYYGNGNPTDFYAFNQWVEDNNRKQYLTFTNTGNGLTLRYNNHYMANSLNSSGKFNRTTNINQAQRFFPATQVMATERVPIQDLGFLVTNTPLEQETSLTVRKNWVIPPDMNASTYEQAQVTVKLLANGTDTGRTVTLSLKNGWEAVFQGLPYADADGNVIHYSVEEVWTAENWVVSYGDVTAGGGSIPRYAVTVTNTYLVGGPELPTTGSAARMMYILCGAGVLLMSLVCGFGVRRKRERRMK